MEIAFFGVKYPISSESSCSSSNYIRCCYQIRNEAQSFILLFWSSAAEKKHECVDVFKKNTTKQTKCKKCWIWIHFSACLMFTINFPAQQFCNIKCILFSNKWKKSQTWEKKLRVIQAFTSIFSGFSGNNVNKEICWFEHALR